MTLIIARDSVEVISVEGYFRAAPVVTVIEAGGHSRVAAIGDEPISNRSGVRINIFSSATNDHQSDGYFETFLQAVLQQLPKTAGIIRPVVIVENLKSLDFVFSGQQHGMAVRAIERWGAVAAVIS